MVQWLYSFAKNPRICPGGIDKGISIESRIIEYKKRTTKTPIIAFDFKASIKLFINSGKVNVCCAGREKLIREKVEHFFKTLTNKFGCKLVFFLDGPIKNHKIPYYLKKINNNYNDLVKYFNITHGIELDKKNVPSHIILPIYYDNILQIAKKYGEIRIALNNENDLDIDKFACDNDILAIFAADTDFVIMRGDYQIWIPDTINLEKFTIDCLNKDKIKNVLKLNVNQMPIFATLYGNTIIPKEKVHHLVSTDQLKVAYFIRSHYQHGIRSKDDFEHFSELLYQKGRNGLSMTQAQSMIRKSLDSYDISKAQENRIEPKWLNEHINITSSAFVYIVINDILFTINSSLIHLNMPNTSKQYSELILQLVLRQMGVILKNVDNYPDIERQILYKPTHQKPFAIYKLKLNPYFPNFELPQIKYIIEGTKEHSLKHSKKIRLLSWLVSPTTKEIASTLLGELFESVYFIPVLILNYFVGERAFSILEADAVLLSISKSIESTVDKLKNYRKPTKFAARPFYVSNVYAESHYYFLNALIVSGLSKCYKGGNFDGFIFQQVYIELLNGNDEERKEMMKLLQSYRIYAN